MKKTALKLYFSPYSPPARGVYLVIKALKLNVELEDVNILSKGCRNHDLLSLNPQYSVPTLKDGNFVISDSHAIAGYLVNSYGDERKCKLYPSDPRTRAIIDQRLFFDTEHLFPKVLETVYPLLFRHKSVVPNRLQLEIIRSYKHLEKFLQHSLWLAGNNLTIADLCCVSSISTLDYLVPVSGEEYPKLKRFLQRCRQLPYYHEANQIGLSMLGNKILERLATTYARNI